MRRSLAFVALLGLLACNRSSPTDPAQAAGALQYGRLMGTVTIGPNCPVETATPCPTPPSAYSLRKIAVYDEGKTKVLFTVDIDQHGLYSIDLTPAKYTLELEASGLDRTADLPQTVTITANTVTRVDVRIDTGLR